MPDEGDVKAPARRDDSVNPIADWYIRNPIVRGLVALVPYAGGALDVAIVTEMDNMGRKKVERFFAELERGDVQLTEEMVKSDDFLHRFTITARAVTMQGQTEKIDLFANLLRNGLGPEQISTAEYEELAQILDTLSIRELKLLDLMEQNMQSLPIERGRPVPAPSEFWNRVIDKVSAALSVRKDELAAMLTRVQRTGCYVENPSTSWDLGGHQGYTTALWRKFRKFVLDAEET